MRRVGANEIEELSALEVKVLYELWKIKRRAPALDESLTVDQLRKRLRYRAPDMIYDAVNALVKRGRTGRRWCTLQVVRGRKEGPGGPTRKAYRMIEQGMVHWSATAFLLLELAYSPEWRQRQVKAIDFCRHLIDDCCFSSQSIVDDYLDYAWKWEYVQKDPEHKHDYRILALGDRAISEKEFLRLVAPYYREELAREDKRVTKSWYFEKVGIPLILNARKS